MTLALHPVRHRLANTLAWLLVTFLVLFPKGGFKLGFIPITWGYILLALCSVPLLFARLFTLPLRLSPRIAAALLCTLPFQAIFAYTTFTNGIAEPGIYVSSVIDFFFFPLLFLLLFPPFLNQVDGQALSRHLRFSILAAALFGIFLFVYHPLVGSYIEIPYLTVNSGDYGLLETTKHIDRGSYLKLISTYNNGNVYGVATLILLPLYNLLEPRRWKRYIVLTALALTLSRTVWAGIFLNEILTLALVLRRSFRNFPRITPGPAVKGAVALAVTLAVVAVGLVLSSDKGLSFLFDKDLGGRTSQVAVFAHPDLVPAQPAGGFGEIVYATAISSYGVFGLIAFLLLFASPGLLYLAQPGVYRHPVQKAALKGLIIYPVVAASDGCINLIPVLVFYWFAYMIFLCGWPSATPLQDQPAQLPRTPQLSAV